MDIGKALDLHCTHVRVCAHKMRPLKDPNLSYDHKSTNDHPGLHCLNFQRKKISL